MKNVYSLVLALLSTLNLYSQSPSTIEKIVQSEEKIEVIEIDTSRRIEPERIVTPVYEDNVIVDVPVYKACFNADCENLSNKEERDNCCTRAILEYCAKVKYPKQAQDLGVEGKVVIRFLVEKDGSISEVVKIRGDDMLADAAIQHIKNSSGRWTPGQNNGAPVRSWFMSPFTFRLR